MKLKLVNALRWLLASMVLAVIAPLFASHATQPRAAVLPPWPHEFDGRPLVPVALAPGQSRLLEDFPGAAASAPDMSEFF